MNEPDNPANDVAQNAASEPADSPNPDVAESSGDEPLGLVAEPSGEEPSGEEPLAPEADPPSDEPLAPAADTAGAELIDLQPELRAPDYGPDSAGGPAAEPAAESAAEANARGGRSKPPAHLSTQCPALDELLDGGIENDAIFLVFGEAGSGKTNLALQCARSAAQTTTNPDGTKKPGKRVAYVDTEGVSARRMEQLFADCPEAQDRLLFFTPFDIGQQERMVQNATKSPDLGLVIVDSINMHYRLHIDGGDEMQKEASRSLVQQLHHLTTFARKHQVPVIVTGQVYGNEDQTQPFARRTMEHLVKALVRFAKTPDGGRKATILKHRSIEEGRQARFKITENGLADGR